MSRTTRNGYKVEDDWPNGLAPLQMYAPWEMTPEQPFRLQRWHEAPTGFHRGEWRIHHTLSEAVDDFLNWPVEQGMIAMMLDESFRTVLGWSASSVVWDLYGKEAWYGVRASYECMETRLDPWTVLDREVEAMVTAT